MLSLLVLAFAVSAPIDAVNSATPQVSFVAGVPEQPDSPAIVVEEPGSSLGGWDIRPNSDICYKIRAYIFSKGRNPRFLRETTCGPKAPDAKDVDSKPGFMPLELKAQPGVKGQN